MRRLNFLCLLLFGVFFTACHSDDDTWGDWSRDNEFPGAKRVLACCFEYKDAAYIGLGYNQSLSRQDKNLYDLWKFDGSTWRSLPDFPAKGRKGTVAFVIGDTAYIGAGFRDKMSNVEVDTFYSDFYKFDLIKEEWVKKPGTNEYARTSIFKDNVDASIKEEDCSFWGGIGFALNGKGYAGTGTIDGGDRESKMIYSYDPATGKWSDSGFPGQSRAGGVVFIVNGQAVVCLGTSSGKPVTDVWAFNGTWNRKEKLEDIDGSWNDDYGKIPRSYGIAFTSDLDGGVELGYVAGGSGANTCWQYNIATDRWDEVTEFNSSMNALRVGAVGFTIKGYGYMTTGGSNLLIGTDNTTWKFTPGIDEDDDNN